MQQNNWSFVFASDKSDKERCIIKKGQTYIDDVLHLPMPYANVLLLQ